MSNAETGLQQVINLLSRVIPNAVRLAESRLNSVKAYQKILQGPLGVGERFSARLGGQERCITVEGGVRCIQRS